MDAQRRTQQTQVLREWFEKDTSCFSPRRKLTWLFKLYEEHVERLMGAIGAIGKPIYPEFFQGDLFQNLYIVSEFVQEQIGLLENAERIGEKWQIMLDQLQKAVESVNDRDLEEIPRTFLMLSKEIMAEALDKSP